MLFLGFVYGDMAGLPLSGVVLVHDLKYALDRGSHSCWPHIAIQEQGDWRSVRVCVDRLMWHMATPGGEALVA